MRIFVGLTLLVCAVSLRAQDSAVVLARILTEKGIISKSDLARVESAGSGEKAQLLTQAAGPALVASAKPAPGAQPPASPPPAETEAKVRPRTHHGLRAPGCQTSPPAQAR